MLLCLSEGCSHSRCIPELWQHCILLGAANRSCPGDRSQGPVPCPPLEMDFLPWCWEAARGSCPRATARAQRRGCRWLRPWVGLVVVSGTEVAAALSGLGRLPGGGKDPVPIRDGSPGKGRGGQPPPLPSSLHRVSRADPGAL